MGSSLRVGWDATAGPDLSTRDFDVDGQAGEIVVRGHLSTGSRGWMLRARANRLRTTVTLQVTAVEQELVRVPDLEFHWYEARIAVRRSGRYRLRITHAYLPRTGAAGRLQHPVHESTVTIPER